MFPISRFFSPFPQRHYKNSSVCMCVCVHYRRALCIVAVYYYYYYCIRPYFFSSQNRIVSHSRGIVTRNGLTTDRRRRPYQTTMGYVAYIIKIIVGQLHTYTYIIYLWALSTIRCNILKVETIPT